MGFNSSSNLYSELNPGYDLPWIISRARLNITTKTKRIPMGDDRSGIKTILIDQLPNVIICDAQLELRNVMNQDEKNMLSSASLESYLEFFNLAPKLDHDYVDLQSRLQSPRSSISDIVNYCLGDCWGVYHLDEIKAITQSKLAL